MAFIESGNTSSVQFLEIHCQLIDPQNRSLNLNEIINGICEGYTKFGEWIDKPYGQECSAMWMLCFTGQYVNLFHTYELKWRLTDSDIQNFQPVHYEIYDKDAANIYRKISESGEIAKNIGMNSVAK